MVLLTEREGEEEGEERKGREERERKRACNGED